MDVSTLTVVLTVMLFTVLLTVVVVGVPVVAGRVSFVVAQSTWESVWLMGTKWFGKRGERLTQTFKQSSERIHDHNKYSSLNNVVSTNKQNTSTNDHNVLPSPLQQQLRSFKSAQLTHPGQTIPHPHSQTCRDFDNCSTLWKRGLLRCLVTDLVLGDALAFYLAVDGVFALAFDVFLGFFASRYCLEFRVSDKFGLVRCLNFL